MGKLRYGWPVRRSLVVLPGVPRPWVFAHRGHSAKAPENTMAAFIAALESGATGTELDVQLCASGEIVVCHDWTLDRTAGAPVRVTDTPWSELREYDVGSWFDPAYADERIPLLPDVLEEFGTSMCFDIEIKHRSRHTTPLERVLARLVCTMGLARRVIVSSFNPFALRSIRRIAPELATALIYADDPEVPRWMRSGAGRILCRPDLLKPHRDLVDARLVRRSTRVSRAVLPWTVNEDQDAERLVALGCAGVISDAPDNLDHMHLDRDRKRGRD